MINKRGTVQYDKTEHYYFLSTLCFHRIIEEWAELYSHFCCCSLCGTMIYINVLLMLNSNTLSAVMLEYIYN